MRGRGYRPATKGTIALMSPNPSFPFGNTTTDPCGFYIPPDGKHCYVGYNGAGQVGMFAREANTGALASLSPATTPALSNPFYLTGSADGLFVYAFSAGGGSIRQWSRNTTTGLLTQLSPFTVSASSAPIMGVFYQGDKYLYVASRDASLNPLICQFQRDGATGKLAPLTTPTLAFGVNNERPLGVAIYDNHVYVGCFGGSLIYAFVADPATGQLSPASTPSYNVGATAPSFIAISPDGKHLYTANDIGVGVSQFSRDSTTGVLTPLSPATVAAGNGPYSIAMTPDGLNLYIGNSDGQSVSQYTRDPATGLLTAKIPAQVRCDPTVGAIAASRGPQSIYVSPDGKNLYLSGKATGGHSLVTFTIRP